MNLDATVISVISSGCVAIAGIMLPMLVNLFNEHVKWSREQKSSRAKRIDSSSIELLDVLADFRSGNIAHATQRPIEEVYSNLLSKYYAWERTIGLYCKESEQERVRKLRAKFEERNYDSLYKNSADLANEILALSHFAEKRV